MLSVQCSCLPNTATPESDVILPVTLSPGSFVGHLDFSSLFDSSMKFIDHVLADTLLTDPAKTSSLHPLSYFSGIVICKRKGTISERGDVAGFLRYMERTLIFS
jgi:hypothetical protein